MSFPSWCLFFDFHTMPANPDVGKGFDYEAIADRFAQAGVGYVVFPARCNLGVAYYDTKLGIRHPALDHNLLKKLVDACHARGIKLTAYMNVGLSHEEALRNRDWMVLDENGQVYTNNRLSSFFRQMCYNSPYGDHVAAMSREILENTGADGLFLDCMCTRPCFCKCCTDAMKAEGVDWNDPKQLHDFNHRKHVAMARRISEVARAYKPDVLLYFNGIGYEAQQEIGSYLEFECLPTGGWGYELLQVGARYLRTLGKPVLNMTGRFHRSWGDFGGIRTEPSLEYDCLYGIANGLKTTIGDHYHPRGDINKAVADLDTRIYKRLQKLDPWLEDAKPLTEIAMPMLKPYPGYAFMDPEGRKLYDNEFTAVKGATRLLCELKQQFDIVSHMASWDDYKVLVLPDNTPMDDETVRRIRKHLDKGGKVIATAWAGVKDGAFAFPEWGVDYKGDNAFDPAFFNMVPQYADGIPDMPNNFYGKGVDIAAKPGTDVLATLVAPYYNRHFDGEHGFVYLPPDKDTGAPAVTLAPQVGYISHEAFGSYFNSANLPLRTLVSKLLAKLLPEPLVKTPDAPAYTRVTVTAQPKLKRRMVHYLAYLPESRGAGVNTIEEPMVVLDQTIRLRQDGQEVKRVYLAPEGKDLPFTVEDGYITVKLDKIVGYALIVFE